MKKYIPALVLLITFIACKGQEESSQGKDFTSKVDANTATKEAVQYPFFDRDKNPITTHFELLPAGEIKPKGWLFDVMKQDISTGFVAELDNLAPDILKEDDLFNTTRRKDPKDIPDVGDQVLTGADWEISMQWWSGESLGHWWDGYVRNAFLTNDEKAIKHSKEIVEYIMTTMDDDGYFGIYGQEMRYQHEGSNGELWTKTTVLRMLIGYYEHTNDQSVLDFVEKAMAETIANYNKGIKSPFDVKADYGGVTHGLMMTDVCEMLYRITGNQAYSDYAVFLYEDFSEYPINRAFNDACYGYLMQKDSLFQSHSAHTYEHLRSVIQTYYATGYPEMEEAYESALKKLSYCILPSGAGFGNEWLNKERAKPNTTGAEVCGMNELKDFFLSALQKTGDVSFGDAAEKMTFNALLGARNKSGTGITYCKTDNCYILNRKAPQHGFEEDDPRYKYSPTHADAAVCCNPSYSRYLPYYVGSMWMSSKDGLAAVLYGPSELKTSINDTDITIEQVTNYPLKDKIEFKISTSKAIELPLYFRKPAWAESINFVGGDAVLEDGYYKITKTWNNGDVVQLSFDNKLQAKEYHNGEKYFQRGPLVFAYDIPHRTASVKEYNVNGFRDYEVFSTTASYEDFRIPSNKDNQRNFSYIKGNPADGKTQWYDHKLHLSGQLLNSKTNEMQEVKLVPMGKTVLRRVTFPIAKTN